MIENMDGNRDGHDQSLLDSVAGNKMEMTRNKENKLPGKKIHK